MNILFVSHLKDSPAAGTNWSIPAKVIAQSDIDNCLWVDVSNADMAHWHTSTAYHNIKEFNSLRLKNLPSPWNKPDIVIFELFYFPQYLRFASELRRKSIPYVIVPRSNFTYAANHNTKHLKKVLAHKLLFNRFLFGAERIQYLTQGEADNSYPLFKKNYFIVPNGVQLPERTANVGTDDKLRAVFVGRIDIYQKGLDLLIEALSRAKEQLQSVGFVLSIYGPSSTDSDRLMSLINDADVQDIAVWKGGIASKEKEDAMLNSDLFVLPSRFEGLPMALLEGLSYGLPCIVSEGTYMKDVVDEYDAGWTYKGSADELAEQLLTMAKEKHLLKQKGKNARQLAERHSWQSCAQTLHDELIKLIE